MYQWTRGYYSSPCCDCRGECLSGHGRFQPIPSNVATIEELENTCLARLLSVVKDLTTSLSQVNQAVGFCSGSTQWYSKSSHDIHSASIVSSRPRSARRHFRIPRALLAANISSLCRNTSLASETTLCWLLAKICPVDSQNYRRPCRKSGQGKSEHLHLTVTCRVWRIESWQMSPISSRVERH